MVVVQADIYRRQRRKVKICVALVTISMQLQHTRQCWQKQRRKKERIWPHSHATGMRCEKPPPLQHIWPWITESVHWWWGRARNRAVAAHRACTHKIWKSAAFSRKIGRTQSLGLLFSNLQKNILRKKVISEKCCRRVSGGACAFSVLWLLCVVYTLLSCWKMVLECTCFNFQWLENFYHNTFLHKHLD